MPLLCDIGLHRPAGWPRWNNGYYFSSCSRCRADLVRTAYGSWRVPRGFRVRWQAEPPAAAVLQAGAPPFQDPDPPAPPVVAGPEEPVSSAAAAAAEPDDLSPGREAAPDEGRAAPADPPSPRPSLIPDFMSESGDSNARAERSRAAAPPKATDPLAPSAAVPHPVRRLWDAGRARASMIRRPSGEAMHRLASPAIVFFGLVILAAVLLALVRWPTTRPDAEVAPAKADAAAQPALQPGWVTTLAVTVEASLLNCRAAPAADSPVLQRLGGGETVQLMDRGPEWAHVDTGRQQCWVLERHLSAPQNF